MLTRIVHPSPKLETGGLVLFGSREGFDRNRWTIELEYRLQYETGLGVADFDEDGGSRPGESGVHEHGVGAGGPLAGSIWKQPR